MWNLGIAIGIQIAKFSPALTLTDCMWAAFFSSWKRKKALLQPFRSDSFLVVSVCLYSFDSLVEHSGQRSLYSVVLYDFAVRFFSLFWTDSLQLMSSFPLWATLYFGPRQSSIQRAISRLRCLHFRWQWRPTLMRTRIFEEYQHICLKTLFWKSIDANPLGCVNYDWDFAPCSWRTRSQNGASSDEGWFAFRFVFYLARFRSLFYCASGLVFAFQMIVIAVSITVGVTVANVVVFPFKSHLIL